MAKDAVLQVRIDAELKKQVEELYRAMGTSFAEAVRMFAQRSILERGLPFPLSTEASWINDLSDPIEQISLFRRDNLRNMLAVIPDTVDELWVFGSSVTPYCRPDSDLDVCIVGDEIRIDEKRLLFSAAGCAVDLIDATHAEFDRRRLEEGDIFSEVYNKGIKIYQKGKMKNGEIRRSAETGGQ